MLCYLRCAVFPFRYPECVGYFETFVPFMSFPNRAMHMTPSYTRSSRLKRSGGLDFRNLLD